MTSNKILIVEGERSIREMIAFHLSRAGYDALEAEVCREARQLLTDERPAFRQSSPFRSLAIPDAGNPPFFPWRDACVRRLYSLLPLS